MEQVDGLRIRVIDLETAGARPAAADVCEIGWQDVVRGELGWQLSEERGARMVHPGGPISPATMAVHHIVDADVEGAPLWRDIAPTVLRPRPAPIALAAHRASFEQRYCTPSLSGGARWICTWKCALRIWPDAPGFSNQMLRYWRMPAGLDRSTGLPAHRALPDAYVTAHHLRDMLQHASVDDLLAWSDEPGVLPRIPSGLNRGSDWLKVSEDDLQALMTDRNEDVRFTARREALRRAGGAAPSLPPPPQFSLF